MNTGRSFSFAFLLAVALGGSSSQGVNAPKGPVAAYILLEGSYLVDDCPICARPTILQPMGGTFKLVRVDQNPLFTLYEVRDVSFVAGNLTNWYYKVTGSGSYQVGGEVAYLQTMTLQAEINNGYTNKLCYFTNNNQTIDRPWPMIHADLLQTNGTLAQVYELNIVAAPVREIWFSTTAGSTSGNWQSPSNHISPGDLISSAGRVVKRNTDLTRNLGLMPIAPDVGLDAVDIATGGEILFSINQSVFSETLGPIQHGDLLSNRGRIVKRNQQLMSAFGLPSTNSDLGLDAVQTLADGSILFSIATNVFSPKTGTLLSRGDVLSDQGVVFRTHQQLLARFHPSQTNQDFGLDALYVWPSGEIWFSTEDGFQDAGLGAVLSGDLLSDQGYRVFGNKELVSDFAPKETNADFGLDALFVVTDFAAPTAPPRLLGASVQRNNGGLAVQWPGQGRAFQLERATAVGGPYLPVSQIMPDSTFTDPLANQPQFFYRLRQW